MGRFMVFRFDQYYPSGGRLDTSLADPIVKSLDEARIVGANAMQEISKYDYYDILDLDTGKWVETNRPGNWEE